MHRPLLLFSRSALKQVIQNRIGVESFTDKLIQVGQNESYTRAAKKPHLHYKHPNEIVFDYEFTRLFKSLESEFNIVLFYVLDSVIMSSLLIFKPARHLVPYQRTLYSYSCHWLHFRAIN